MFKEIFFMLFRKPIVKQQPKDEDITVVPERWNAYPDPPKFLLPETQAVYNERAQHFLAIARERFLKERDEYLRKVDEYKAAKATHDQACAALNEVENASYPSPLDREIAIRQARAIRDSAASVAEVLSWVRQNNSLEYNYRSIRGQAERILRKEEERKIRNGDHVHSMRGRENIYRTITCIGSRFFLVGVYNGDFEREADFITESLSQMNDEELQAIKTYQCTQLGVEQSAK